MLLERKTWLPTNQLTCFECLCLQWTVASAVVGCYWIMFPPSSVHVWFTEIHMQPEVSVTAAVVNLSVFFFCSVKIFFPSHMKLILYLFYSDLENLFNSYSLGRTMTKYKERCCHKHNNSLAAELNGEPLYGPLWVACKPAAVVLHETALFVWDPRVNGTQMSLLLS